MANETQIENLRVAYSVMAGVPSRIVSLGDVRATSIHGPEPGISDKQLLRNDCGAVACAAGLLSAHPHFKAQGLSYMRQEICMHGNPMPLAITSNILFEDNSIFDGGPCGKEGKLVALRRIRTALLALEAITPSRSNELVAYEESFT